MSGTIFGQILKAGREGFNGRFRTARLRYPHLEATDFGDFLAAVVAPVVEAVAIDAPTKAVMVAEELYDLALDLTGREFVGSFAKFPGIAVAWRCILPKIPELVAEAPFGIARSVTNAVIALTTQGSEAQLWLDRLTPALPFCRSVDDFEGCARLAAWRCGLAHLRDRGLKVANTLPADAVAGIINISGAPGNNSLLIDILQKLHDDPWFEPGSSCGTLPRYRFKTGGFLGFNGRFITPPKAWVSGDRILVRDADRQFLLCADAFGASLVEVQGQFPPDSPRSEFETFRNGSARIGSHRFSISEFSKASSFASDGRTVAVTLVDSHWIFIYG